MSKKQTPWALNAKTVEAIADMLADKMKRAEEAMALSNEIGKVCSGRNIQVAEMALGIVLAHIISEHPPEHRQKVFDRICDQLIALGDR